MDKLGLNPVSGVLLIKSTCNVYKFDTTGGTETDQVTEHLFVIDINWVDPPIGWSC
jgi:hypothetical protein